MFCFSCKKEIPDSAVCPECGAPVISSPADDFEREVNKDGTITVVGYKGAGGEVGIPPVIDGKSVTGIGLRAFYEHKDVTGVSLPASVTSIRGFAFAGTAWFDAKMKEAPLVIVNGILIGGYTASGDVEIPDGVTVIGENAFDSCSEITGISVPDSVTRIEGAAFEGCSGLTDMTVPDSVAFIGDYAFAECASLESIHLPGSLKSIEHNTFQGCVSLLSITVPDGTERIGREAFLDCESLREVIIPDSVTELHDTAFEGCFELEKAVYKGHTYTKQTLDDLFAAVNNY